MCTTFYRTLLIAGLVLFTAILPSAVQADTDCDISDDALAGIRQMLTAEDSGVFFGIWTNEEIFCACHEIFYNDPEDAWLHDRVITGAVVLISLTEDPRAVPVLIDAIDTHAPQALYNLGNFSTIEALNALVANVQNEDEEARENAAEGLRRMKSPEASQMEDGWSDALEAAIEVVGDWITQEPVPDFRDYFLDAHINLEQLLEKAVSSSGVE